jgi:micrococcal nuclease
MDSRCRSLQALEAPLAGLTFLGLVAIADAPALAADNFRGPVEAIVINVLDGDTFLADAHIWPGQSVRVNVRIRGIDAPEMKSRCVTEHLAALRARDALSSLVEGDAVLISNIGGAKYYGRVLADVETAKGEAIGPALLGQRLVRHYSGGKRDSWCG